MTIDADTVQTIITGALGACAVLFGSKGIRRLRNGKASVDAFKAQREMWPGYAPICLKHNERLLRLESPTRAEQKGMSDDADDGCDSQ